MPILVTYTHLLDEFSSCMYDRSCNGKLVELRLKLILFLERQNQIWFHVVSINLIFVEQLDAGSLPMDQWCHIGARKRDRIFINEVRFKMTHCLI